MIYVDTSVVLAELLSEDRVPPPEFWNGVLVSSRLLAYEAWNRIHARDLQATHGGALRVILARIGFAEMSREVLDRALAPMPVPVRTLDGLHLATADFIRRQGQRIEIATYDERIARGATALGFRLVGL